MVIKHEMSDQADSKMVGQVNKRWMTPDIPKEFSKAVFLVNSEALQLLKKRYDEDALSDTIREPSVLFKNAMYYLDRLNMYRSPESITAVRADFDSSGLNKREIVQIANLSPDSAEEAKELIPRFVRLWNSITDKIDDVELNELLFNLKQRKTMR